MFFALGLLLLVFSGALLRKDRRLVRNGQRADAEVVGMRQSVRHGYPTGSYWPVVRFRTADGREVERATKRGGGPPDVRRGDRVRVIYQPGADDNVIIDNFKGRGLLSVLVLSVIGLALLAIGMSPMIPHGSAAGGSVGPLCLGLGFMAVGVGTFYQDRRRGGRHGRRACAEVVELVRKHFAGHEGGGTVYHPVVRFHTDDGQEVVTPTAGWIGSGIRARPGDQVRVRYELGNSRNVTIDTIMGRGLVPGGAFLIVGLWIVASTIYLKSR